MRSAQKGIDMDSEDLKLIEDKKAVPVGERVPKKPEKRAEKAHKMAVRYEQGGRPKHAIWIDFKRVKLDQRSKLAKTIKFIRGELVRHVGGAPSVAQSILIDRVVYKTIKCYLWETNFFSEREQGSRDHYLALANSLRLDLALLGLAEKEVPDTPFFDHLVKLTKAEKKAVEHADDKEDVSKVKE